MTKNRNIRIAIVGVGIMGKGHARRLLEGGAPSVTLSAICDPKPEVKGAFPGIPYYESLDRLFECEKLDAIFVSTPHPSHMEIGVAALDRGLHVLLEKPMSSSKARCERLLEAKERSGKVLSVMHSMRTKPVYKKIKQLLEENELGAILRVNWTVSHWFRTNAYYASAPWRGTWKGEGGGVLLNQCPHQLDLLTWFFGLPEQVTAFCDFGRHHPIETEDDVTAVLHYPSRMKAVFVASTGEAPGTNRLEISGERGRLVAEGQSLRFDRNRQAATDFSHHTKDTFGRPECWSIELPLEQETVDGHMAIFENFARAVLYKEPLIAPSEDAISSVELANAMQYSTWEKSTISLPLDSAAFEARLLEIATTPPVLKSI